MNQDFIDFEKNNELIFLHPGQPVAELPEWERVRVGKSCVALCQHGVVVAGDSRDNGDRQSRIIWATGSVATLKMPVDYPYRESMRGRREDCVPTVSRSGQPVPEVQLLIAFSTNSDSDRYNALSAFIQTRPELADILRETVETVVDLSAGESPTTELAETTGEERHDPLMSIVGDPVLYMRFVGAWIVLVLQGEHHEKLVIWQAAVKRALTAIEEFSRPREVNYRTRVLAAIRQAAAQCGGLPHQKLVRDLLDADGHALIPKETVRTTLKTLGYEWIPGKPAWRKHWEPRLEKGGFMSTT